MRVLTTLGAVATLGIVVAGTAPAAAAKAPKPTVVQVRTTSNVPLADAANTPTSVASVSLTKGAWTVTSDVTAVDFGAGDFVRCHLENGTTTIGGGATTYLANRVSGLVDVGTITLTAAGTVAVLCQHDDAAASAGQFYADSGATVTAVKAGPIAGPGATITKKTVVAQSRTSSSTSLRTNQAVIVTSMTLPAGTWALTGTLSAVNFSDEDFVYCDLDDNGYPTYSSGNFDGFGLSDDYVNGIDTEGTVTVPKAGAFIDLQCTATTDDGYVDAGATLTATKVKPAADVDVDVEGATLPQSGMTNVTIGSGALPAGSWRVRSSIDFGDRTSNGGYESVRDFLRCTLEANGVSIDGGATELITGDSYHATVVNAGTYTATGSWTLSLVCEHDYANTDAGRWQSDETLLQAIDQGPISATTT